MNHTKYKGFSHQGAWRLGDTGSLKQHPQTRAPARTDRKKYKPIYYDARRRIHWEQVKK